MQSPGRAALRHQASSNTLASGEKERKTPRDIRLEDKEAYDSQDECLSGSPRNVHGVKWALAVLGLMSLPFVVAVEATSAATAQSSIDHRFPQRPLPALYSAAFFAAGAATVLTWRQMYGLFRLKPLLLASVLSLAVGGAVSGAAPTVSALVIGRAMAGMGSGGVTAGVWTALSTTTTEKEASLYHALQVLAWGLGILVGPVEGGGFAGSGATWRGSYYLTLCIAALVSPLLFALLPPRDPQPNTDLRGRIIGIDALGTLLLVASIVPLFLAINLGGRVYAWGAVSVILLWLLSGFSFTAFCLQQRFAWLARQPLFPIAVVRDWTLVALFLVQTCSVSALFVACYFIPLYLEIIHNAGTLATGIHLLPLLTFAALTAMSSHPLARRSRLWPPCILLGGALVLIGGALMYTVDAHTPISMVYGYSSLIGAGVGLCIQLPAAACHELVSPVLAPSAAAFLALAQFAAPALTLSVAYAVYGNTPEPDAARVLADPRYHNVSTIAASGPPSLQALDASTRHELARAVAGDLARPYILVMASGVLTTVLGSALFCALPRPARA